MKKYRIEMDKLFIAAGTGFVYGYEVITGMSMFFEYRVFDKSSGKEIFFSCDDNAEPKPQPLDGHDLNEYFICNYDCEKGYVMLQTELCKESRYRIEYTVSAFYKIVHKGELFGAPLNENEFVNEDEFLKVLRDHPDFFDTSTNVNAQSTSYGYYLAN